MSTNNGVSYNLCHCTYYQLILDQALSLILPLSCEPVWSNFEIADMEFWRGPAYTAFFEYLDSKGGFYYERWGDAPVHSIAAALFLPRDKIQFFDEIGYEHNPYTHCPKDKATYEKGRCTCDQSRSFGALAFSPFIYLFFLTLCCRLRRLLVYEQVG
jgi:alpha 1,2-mannosyltransferase